MSDSTPQPLWIPTDLDKAFKNSVVQAFGAPHLYNPRYVPVPWMIGFFGRSGMHKPEVVRLLCAKYGLSFSTTFFEAKMGTCGKLLNEVECTIKAVVATWEKDLVPPASGGGDDNAPQVEGAFDGDGLALPPAEGGGQSNGPRHLIIIDKADVLCYEADSESTLLRAAQLSELAGPNRVMIMGIFDRLPGEVTGQLAPWVREAQSKFWAQFDTLLYIEAPNADFRASLFRYYVEDFVRFYNEARGRASAGSAAAEGRGGENYITNTLTQVEYERLADFSSFATPENILAFLRKVFSAVMIKGDEMRELTVDFIETFLSNRHGAPHVCEFDARDVDNRFATACGRGPAVAKKDSKVLKKPKPNTDLTNVTGFTEDNVDLQKVMGELAASATPREGEVVAPGSAGGDAAVDEGKSFVVPPGSAGGDDEDDEIVNFSPSKKLKLEN